MEGVKSFDGKLERNDLPSDDSVEEVMKKSDKKREYLKKRPSMSKVQPSSIDSFNQSTAQNNQT